MNGSNLASLQLFLGKTSCHRKMTWYSQSLLFIRLYLPPGRHKASVPSPSLILPHTSCRSAFIYTLVWVLTAARVICAEFTPALLAELCAIKATLKWREQGTRILPEIWRTRRRKLKWHHSYCMQQQGFSVWVFLHSRAFSKGSFHFMSKQTEKGHNHIDNMSSWGLRLKYKIRGMWIWHAKTPACL